MVHTHEASPVWPEQGPHTWFTSSAAVKSAEGGVLVSWSPLLCFLKEPRAQAALPATHGPLQGTPSCLLWVSLGPGSGWGGPGPTVCRARVGLHGVVPFWRPGQGWAGEWGGGHEDWHQHRLQVCQLQPFVKVVNRYRLTEATMHWRQMT